MNLKLDIRHIVVGNILCAYPTAKVEKKLSTKATLKKDLGLLESEIYELGQIIKENLRSRNLPVFTDHQIANWQTVDDIIKTIDHVIRY